jgi:Cu2+-exporting ATPase
MQLIPNSAIAPNSVPDSPAPTLTFAVSGMKCAGCVKAVETQLCNHPEVQSATVNLVTELATVECAPQADVEELARQLTERLTEAGFPAQPRREQGAGGDRPEDWSNQRDQERRDQLRQVAIASMLLLLSAIGHLDHWGWVRIPILSSIGFHFGLATLALAIPGRSMIRDGWRGLRRNAPNMNTLVALGTVTAYLTSTVALFIPSLGWECFFDEPVMLVGFILLGRTLEQQARHRAAAALEALIALKPSMARLIDAADNESPLTATATAIPASDVQVGTWLQVLPGDKMPVDGTVVAGQTTVDESMVTGESMPVLKQPGDAVVAGSLNQSGAIAIRATRVGRDTTLAQMIHLVETAQTRKAPIQKVADAVAGYFTYGVMAIAALTFLFWYSWGVHAFPWVLDYVGPGHSAMAEMPLPLDSVSPVQYGGLLLSLKLAIAVLVVACPCALGLATPTALLVGSGIGAERGLLLRGGDVLETMHHVDTVVFDKTGTLTSGHPQVTDCCALDPRWSDRDLLQWAATVEYGTHHPIAQAIQQAAQQQSLPLLNASGFVTEPGLGVAAEVEQQWVQLGTLDWLTQQQIPISTAVQKQVQTLSAEGKTVVLVAIAQAVVGILGVQDKLRSDAVATVEDLEQMGLQVLIMSGDQPAVAEAIAQAVHIPADRVYSGMQPAQKAEAIAQLQAQGRCVLMIGDGINDAPALAQADASMAMHSGTSVAIETSDIVLMGDRLNDTVEALRLSRRTFNKIRQNLFWACIYNTLGIPAAAGVFLPGLGLVLSPAVAGGFMALSSVSVVTNSLLLRRHYTDFKLWKSR